MIPFLIVIGILILAYFLFFLENRRFVVRRDTIRHEKIQKPFTVVQVSDLHDARFGTDQNKLLAAIQAANPDFIAITGDLFNRKRKDAVQNAVCFVRQAVQIAPVFFVEGNHECALGETGEADIDLIRDLGVYVLRDEYIDRNEIRLIGLRQYTTSEKLSSMLTSDRFNLVLSHRPERFSIYAEAKADFILSGHAHGGQVRLFGIGLYAPEQGILPKYTSGMYCMGKSQMYVSRGLGNTVPVPRIFNTPELNILNFTPIEQKENEHVCECS